MNITLYRYQIKGAIWGEDSLSTLDLEKAESDMAKLPLQGEDPERKYGVTYCGIEEDVIFGLFVQEFPKMLTRYDSETKEESNVDEIDSGSYLFIIFPEDYVIYLQAKRSSDLPSNEEIIKRFIAVIRLANRNNKLLFTDLARTEDLVDRDKIVDIFYNQAESVTELELEEFDADIITNQRKQRGKVQTYFNPIEEYQEAAQEGAIRFATHTDKVSLKTKQGESFKKDPIARAMLEGSKKPIKIIYKKDSETITQYGITKSREVISVPANFNLDSDSNIKDVISYLKGERRSSSIIRDTDQTNSNQTRLV